MNFAGEMVVFTCLAPVGIGARAACTIAPGAQLVPEIEGEEVAQ